MSEVSAFNLLLQPEQNGKAPGWLGRAAQAIFLGTLEDIDPNLSKAIHDSPGLKPFTSTSLIGARKHNNRTLLSTRQTLRIRYTTLHPGLTLLVQGALLPNWHDAVLFMCNHALRVVGIETKASRNTWADRTDYVKLVDTAPTHHTITLVFTSPTTFKRTAGGYQPLPQAELVFSSLLDRWNSFAPFRLPHSLYDTIHEDILVDRVRIQTEEVSFARGKRSTIPGFTGKVTYRLCCDKENRHYVNALAYFAKYSGIGAKTTVGMGQAHSVKAEG
jgi:CRISPR-associated endoribonuclease Cas6